MCVTSSADVRSRCTEASSKSWDELRTIYKSVVLAKLLYAVPAWWGFTTADDKRRLEAFVRRGVRLNLYLQHEPTITQLVGQHEDSLFQAILDDESHVIHHLLLPSLSNTYNLDQDATKDN